MFAVRLVVLLFWVAFSWGMGQTPPDKLNEIGKAISLLFFVAAPMLYLLPTFEAALRRHRNLVPIALINVLLGWTVFGWVAAYVWSLIQAEKNTPARDEAMTAIGKNGVQKKKLCPFCAEEIMAAAVKCKHCNSSLTGN